MHYEIDYSKMTEEEKQTQAVKDIKDYLGAKFDDINAEVVKAVKEMKADGLSIDDMVAEFRFPLSFAGIQGYPVRAWVIEAYYAD